MCQWGRTDLVNMELTVKYFERIVLLVFHVIWQKIWRDAMTLYGWPSCSNSLMSSANGWPSRSNGLTPSMNRWLSRSNSLMFLMSGWRSSSNGLMFLVNGWPSHSNGWQAACKRKAIRHVVAWEVTILNFFKLICSGSILHPYYVTVINKSS